MASSSAVRLQAKQSLTRLSKRWVSQNLFEYNKFLDERSWELEHYFRTIYQLFRHVKDGVDEELINTREAKKYYDLIKSQLSSYELGLLMLNCNGRNKGRWGDIVNDPIACPFEHISDKIMAICENK